jgi:hypothetical protein
VGEHQKLAIQLIELFVIYVTADSVSASKFIMENQSIFEMFVCSMGDVSWDLCARIMRFIDRAQHLLIVEIDECGDANGCMRHPIHDTVASPPSPPKSGVSLQH